MTLADATRPYGATGGRTLASRRPGHAVMARALSEVGPAARTQVAPQMPHGSRSWYDGAIGELIVGHELSKLPPGWRVLHAVPIGRNGRDIDHLVIGPSGVFVLNTKRHLEARIRVGTHVSWVREETKPYQARIAEVSGEVATALASALPDGVMPVPVLVFVQCRQLDQVGPQLVAALQSEKLIPYLLSQRVVLSSEQIARITAVAERPETWGAAISVLDEPDPTIQFLGLRPPVSDPVAVGAPVRSGPLPTPQSQPASVDYRSRPARQPVKRAPPQPRSPKRAGEVVVGLLTAILIVPISIGLLQAAVQVWVALLPGH